MLVWLSLWGWSFGGVLVVFWYRWFLCWWLLVLLVQDVLVFLCRVFIYLVSQWSRWGALPHASSCQGHLAVRIPFLGLGSVRDEEVVVGWVLGWFLLSFYYLSFSSLLPRDPFSFSLFLSWCTDWGGSHESCDDVMGLKGILGGFKMVLKLVAQLCILPYWLRGNWIIGITPLWALICLLGLVTPLWLRCSDIQADGLLYTNFLPEYDPINRVLYIDQINLSAHNRV